MQAFFDMVVQMIGLNFDNINNLKEFIPVFLKLILAICVLSFMLNFIKELALTAIGGFKR